MNSKTIDKLSCSRKEEDFVYYSEQFEARIYDFKLNKILDGFLVYIEGIPTLRGTTQEQIHVADRKRKQFFDRQKQRGIWYKLVQCLEKSQL